METFWQVFLGALGAGGVLVGILAFLGKAFVGQLLAKDLERFRTQLEGSAAEKVEVLRKVLA